MRIRIPVVITVLLGLGAVFATSSWAQPVPATARPAVAPAATPVVVAPQAAAPAVGAVPAVAAAAVPTPAAMPHGIAPAAAPVALDQLQTPPPPPPPPPVPPAPPAPAQAPKVQAPKVIAPAEAPPGFLDTPAANMNVRVDVTIIDQSGSGAPTRKTVSLTVADNGRGSVRSGVTVPIPNITYVPSPGAKEGPTTPMTSYNYRDMGLSLDVTDARIRGNYVRLRLAVEYNPVDEKMASAEGSSAPAIGQTPVSFARFSQTLDLALENGKSLIVAASSDPVPSRNRTASLEVKATILK